MIRFYGPEIGTTGKLPETESAHCCRVLRLKEGDSVEVVDGRGGVFSCVITSADPRHTALRIVERRSESLHWKPSITLAVAPTKNIDRMEWLAEKAVEIGVNRLVFLNCSRSVRKVVKRERMEKILVSAMKQSLKARIPEFEEMMDFSRFIAEGGSSLRFVGYCDDETPRVDFAGRYDGVSDLTVLIGPEGDFTPEEIGAALKAGYVPVTFGSTRLRTETAALFALCAAHTLIARAELTSE